MPDYYYECVKWKFKKRLARNVVLADLQFVDEHGHKFERQKDVLLHFTLDDDGNVGDIAMTDGEVGLDESEMDAFPAGVAEEYGGNRPGFYISEPESLNGPLAKWLVTHKDWPGHDVDFLGLKVPAGQKLWFWSSGDGGTLLLAANYAEAVAKAIQCRLDGIAGDFDLNGFKTPDADDLDDAIRWFKKNDTLEEVVGDYAGPAYSGVLGSIDAITKD